MNSGKVATLHKLIWRRIGVLLLLGLAVSCGGGSGAGAGTPERDALSSDLEQKAAELEAEFARLERQRHQPTPSPRDDGDEATIGAVLEKETVDAPQPEPRASPASEAEPSEEPRELSARERCKIACRALASMERSANGICSLVGDAHEKCVWARTQLRDARRRVEQASCNCD